MRKIIFILAAMAVVASCSQSRKWTDKEREEVRELVRNHRDRVAIRHMEESNYQNLEQCVLTTIEETYPDYNQYNKLTGKTDTLNAVIIRLVRTSKICRFCSLWDSCSKPEFCPTA